MNMRSWGWLVICGMSMPCFAVAHLPADTTLHLEQALFICSKNYPSVRAKEALQKAAAEDLSAEKMNYLPQLVLQDQYLFASTNNVQGASWSNAGTTLSVTGGTRDENIYQGVWTSYATMLIDWKFFNFGKVKAGIRVAENALKKSNAALENEIFRQQVKVADAYLLLIAMKQFVTTQQQNLERAEVFRQAILANTLSGLRPGTDSSLANAEVAKAKLTLLQAKQEERTQQNKLAQLIGLTGPIPEPDTAFFIHAIPATSDLPDTIDAQRSPILRYYRSIVDLQQSRAAATKRSVFPSISFLSAGWARGSGVDNMTGQLHSDLWGGIRPRALNYMAGVAFRWNILSIPQVKKQYRGDLQRSEYTGYLLEEATLRSNMELANAKLRLSTALEQVEQAPLQYDAALQAYHQSEARYRAGLSAIPELYQALYTLNRAAADQLTAYNNAWRALLMEAAAAGDLSVFIHQISQH